MLLAECYPQHAALLTEAVTDDLSARAVLDLIEEEGLTVHPFKVGEAYLIQTVTLYFVGRVVEVSPCWVRLDRASWVHWTGRLGTLMAKKTFAKKAFPDDEAKPRTEYVGDWLLSLAAVVGAGPLPVSALPTESIL